MNNKRSVCPVACALDLFGDKWTLLIVRDLSLGRKYFKEFLSSPEGIASNILSDRLKKLLELKLVRPEADQATVGRDMYFLTEKGEALIPIVEQIKYWGLKNIKGTSARLVHNI